MLLDNCAKLSNPTQKSSEHSLKWAAIHLFFSQINMQNLPSFNARLYPRLFQSFFVQGKSWRQTGVASLSSLKLVSFFRNQVLQSTKTKWWQLLFFFLRDVILELNCSRTELKVWTHCFLLAKTAHTIYLDNIIVTGFVILFTFPLFC